MGRAQRATAITAQNCALGASIDVAQLTLSFWFSLASLETARELVNKFGTDGNIAYGAEHSAAGENVYFRISTDRTLGVLTDLPSTGSLAPDQWRHFARTYDGAEMRLYIDGALDNSAAKTGAIFNSSSNLQIGRYDYFPGWDFHGTIDEVAIRNRALTESEVASLYANGGKP